MIKIIYCITLNSLHLVKISILYMKYIVVYLFFKCINLILKDERPHTGFNLAACRNLTGSFNYIRVCVQ